MLTYQDLLEIVDSDEARMDFTREIQQKIDEKNTPIEPIEEVEEPQEEVE